MSSTSIAQLRPGPGLASQDVSAAIDRGGAPGAASSDVSSTTSRSDPVDPVRVGPLATVLFYSC